MSHPMTFFQLESSMCMFNSSCHITSSELRPGNSPWSANSLSLYIWISRHSIHCVMAVLHLLGHTKALGDIDYKACCGDTIHRHIYLSSKRCSRPSATIEDAQPPQLANPHKLHQLSNMARPNFSIIVAVAPFCRVLQLWPRALLCVPRL